MILMRLWRYRLCVVVLLLSSQLMAVRSLNAEGQLLYTFKETLVDVDNHLSNWNASDATPCSWTGVNCTSEGSVSAIVFPQIWSMSGPFPTETFGKVYDL